MKKVKKVKTDAEFRKDFTDSVFAEEIDMTDLPADILAEFIKDKKTEYTDSENAFDNRLNLD